MSSRKKRNLSLTIVGSSLIDVDSNVVEWNMEFIILNGEAEHLVKA